MLRFIFRRLFFILSVSLLIVFSVHFGMRMARNSNVKEPDYDVVAYGQQAWIDTRGFLSETFKGDIGTVNHDVLGVIPIWDLLSDSYGKSIGLLLISLAYAVVLGLTLGAIAALVKQKQIVLLLLMLTILGISTPSFFAGLLLQQGEFRYYAIFGHRLVKMSGFGWDFEHLLMPVLVLMARPLAYLTRASFISLNRILEKDYIRTAHAKGLSKLRTINIHALRNMGVPILTAIGVSLRFSLSTLPVVEFFFAWPGIGLRLLEAINARQTQVVVSLALALGLTFLIVNLFLDIAYKIIDPRLRETT
ncbi:MAG: ABC transporter permease [Chloroflexota bacterium]